MLNLKEFINRWCVDGACIVRTLSVLTDLSEQEVFDEYIKDDHMVDGRMEVSHTDLLGILVLAGFDHEEFWKPISNTRADRPNMAQTTAQIASDHPDGKFLVMNVTNHVLAIVDGVIHDTQPLSSRLRYPTDIVYSIFPNK